jgi:hypothetical protein
MKQKNKATWRQHYIPQFLLNKFNEDNSLMYCEDMNLNRAEHRNPKSIMYEKYFYSERGLNENNEVVSTQDDVLEHEFNSIETDFADDLKKNTLHTNTVAHFLFSLLCRYKSVFVQQYMSVFNKCAKQITLDLTQKYGAPAYPVEIAGQILIPDGNKLKVYNKNVYGEIQQFVDSMNDHNFDNCCNAVILDTSKNQPLILSDCPVGLSKDFLNIGLCYSYLWLPVSPFKVLVLYGCNANLEEIKAQINEGDNLNCAQIQMAHKHFVYCGKYGLSEPTMSMIRQPTRTNKNITDTNP